MKHTTLKTITMLGLFLMLAVASVHAQSNHPITVNVPFDFFAGDTKLKAGAYTVRRSSAKILVVRGDDSKDVFVFAPYTVQRPEADLSSKLVFHRYGDEYFLTQAWTSSEPIGTGLNESKAERRLARELAKTNARPKLVELVARAN
jgi:hypothetical protein